MPSANLTLTLSILIPVMFLVVVEMAGIVRGIDLRENLPKHVSKENRPRWEEVADSLLHYLPGIERDEPIPTWGHAGTIHAFNMAILMYGLITVNYGMTGEARYLLSVAVAIMAGVLPLLEIDEYSDLNKPAGIASSFHFNLIGMIVLSPFFGFIGRAIASDVPRGIVIVYGVIVVVLLGIELTYFGVLLRREVESTVVEQ